jgi:aminoglycoside 3-N-acetyltransferase
MRNFLRRITPAILLTFYRSWIRRQQRKALATQKERGEVVRKQDIVQALQLMGLQSGDVVMVHSSLSSIGYVENGPKTVVEAFLEVIGEGGHLLMPSAPNASYQLDYIRKNNYFDVQHTPSALGAVTECFRMWSGVERSAHPTEPVCCLGPRAKWFIESHFSQLTPYNEFSPFRKVMSSNGKIIYLGVTLANAGTHLHTLEDAVENFRYPVYYPENFEISVLFSDGREETMLTKVHDPEQSKLRKCDELIPLFEKEGVLKRFHIGKASCLFVDARSMFETMLKNYKEHGITMYTPLGS